MLWMVFLSVLLVYVLVGTAYCVGTVIYVNRRIWEVKERKLPPPVVAAVMIFMWPLVGYWELQDLRPELQRVLDEAKDRILQSKGIAP